MIKRLKSKVKRLILISSGNYNHLKKRVNLKHSWYGTLYGGFYIYPEFLNEKSIIYSFGLGTDISFDKAIIKKHNCNVYGFDPTPKSIAWIKNQDLPEKFIFRDYGISNSEGIVDFFLPKNPENISGSYVIQRNINYKEKVKVKMKSLSDIINEFGHKNLDVLKLDIEGAEFDVITNIIDSGISISQLLVEFHTRLVENGKVKAIQAIRNLKSKGFEIFAISDSFEEVSFINLHQIK